MFNFFNNLTSQLTTPVGNRQDSEPLDVINTRRNFASLGRHSEDIQRPIIDRELDSSIRGFQRDKGLKEDGLMNPDGQTERALNRDLSRGSEAHADLFTTLLSLSEPVGNNKVNRNQDVQQVQRGLGGLGFASEFALFEPSGIIDRETIDGIKNFQTQNNLRIDGVLNPGGETETAISESLRTSVSTSAGENGEGEALPKKLDCSAKEAVLGKAEVELNEAEAALAGAKARLANVQTVLEQLRQEFEKLGEQEKPKEHKCVTEKKAFEDAKKRKNIKEAEVKALKMEIDRLTELLGGSALGVGSGAFESALGTFSGRGGKRLTGMLKTTLSASDFVKAKATLKAARQKLVKSKVELTRAEQKADQAAINLQRCEISFKK